MSAAKTLLIKCLRNMESRLRSAEKAAFVASNGIKYPRQSDQKSNLNVSESCTRENWTKV
jgi:hypothetical protein